MRYLAGPSRLWLPGHPDGVDPGATFDHAFDGTGGFGADQEAMLIAAGAMTPVDEAASVAPVGSTDNQPGDAGPQHQE